MGVERAIQRAQTADIRVFLIAEGDALPLEPQKDDIVLRPKADVTDSTERSISGKTGFGVSELIADIQQTLLERSQSAGLATHERHRIALVEAQQNLTEVKVILQGGPDLYDIASAELRLATRALEVLVGHVDVENLLDEIFASFCLGK
jgi:tRNA modification GTPase